MSAELALSMGVPIFKQNGDMRNLSCYGVVLVLELGMKVMEAVLEKKAL